jgi:regulator of sigma E protease
MAVVLDTLLHWLIGAVAILGMFLLLVAPHEAGHMAIAKLFGVRVYEYAVGMGSKLWSFTRGGTVYALRMIPIGGYVRLAGMEEGDFEAIDGFHTKPAYQRALVLLAGPCVNFLMAAVLATGLYMTQLNDDPGKVVGVQQGTPAYAAGLRPNDSIRAVNGTKVARFDQIQQIERKDPTKPLALTVARPDGSTFTASVTPRYDSQNKAYLIGISVAPVVTPADALRAGVEFPWTATQRMVSGIAMLVTGQVPGGLLGSNGVTGAVGIGYITYESALAGPLYWVQLAALFSMALGLANLLPLPALDGGRLLVVAAEKLRGRPFDREREMAIQRAGLVALFALMILIAFLDVQRIATGQFQGLK